MGFRIEAPKQDGNARFNTLKVNLNENNLATRVVVVDGEGKFYYGTGGGGGTGGTNGTSGTSGPTGASGTSGTSGTGFNTIANPLQGRLLISDGSVNRASASAALFYDTGSSTLQITGSLVTDNLTVNADVFEFTGSIKVLGSITGSLFGTSSWAVSASYAATTSYVSSSNVYGPYGFDSIKTASLALTASSADNFYIRADKFEFTGSLEVNGGITGSLLGTASYAVTASHALNVVGTASWAYNALTASSADDFYIRADVFEFTGSLRVSGSITGSLLGTASYAVTASHALNVVGTASWAYNALTASSADDFLVRGTLTAQTIVAQVITSSTQYITGSTIFGSQLSNTHQFTGSVSITGSLTTDDLTVLADKFEFTGSLEVLGGITGSLYGTSSWAISASWSPGSAQSDTASYVSSSNVYGPYGFDSIKTASFAFTASSADDFTIRSDKFEFTGSLEVLGGITGSLLGTASYAPNIYNTDGELTGNRTISASFYSLSVISTKSTGSTFTVSHIQTQSNATDTADIGMQVSYNLSASSATNQLVARAFQLSVANNLTGSGILQNLRVFNLAAFFGTGTTTSDADLVYLERGNLTGTINNYRAIRIANFTGTNRGGIAIAAIGGTGNAAYINMGSIVIPNGRWGIYQSEVAISNYFAGDFSIGTTTTGSYKLHVIGNTGISGSLTATGSIFFPSLIESPETNIVLVNTSTGQLHYTASSALIPLTASYALTASSADDFYIRADVFEFTGSLRVSGSITGSLLGTASYAVTAAYALNAEGLSGGTTNYIPIWTGTSTLSSSILYQTESRVGINTTAPSHSLHIVGSENTGSFIFYTEASGGLPSFRVYNSARGISNPGLLTSSFNEAFGSSALLSSSISNNRLNRNVALGASAMRDADNIRGSIAIGVSAMTLATGSASAITGSIAIGEGALGRQLGGIYNIAIGASAMLGVSSTQANSGDRNLAIGGTALGRNTTGNRNNAVGDTCLANNSVGSFNTGNGNRALQFNTSGSYNSALGIDALNTNTTASYGTAIGAQALYDNLTGDRNIALGFDAGRGITSGRANTIIGSVTGLSAGLSNNIILADGDGNIRASHNAVSWSFSGSVVAPQGFTGSLFGTSSWAYNALTASSADDFYIRADVFEFTGSLKVDGGITGSLYGTSSWAVSASWAPSSTQSDTASYVSSSNVYGPYGFDSIQTASYAATASSADDFYIRSDVFEFTGSLRVSGSITGSLLGTASFATTASYALNALSAPAFPFSGSAVITGSLLISGSSSSTTYLLNASGTSKLTTIHVENLKNPAIGASGQIDVFVVNNPGDAGYQKLSILAGGSPYSTVLRTSGDGGGSRGMILDASGPGGEMYFGTSNANRWLISGTYNVSGSGHIFPIGDALYDIGNPTAKVANYYGARNYISNLLSVTGSALISGSVIITGSLNVNGGITGSLLGTASFALTSSNVLGGTTSYIPLWNGATVLGSSVVYQSSGNLGIGLTNPTSTIHISGSANATLGLRVENANSSNTDAFSSFQAGTSVANNRFINVGFAGQGVILQGAYRPTGSFIVSNGNGGLNFLATGSGNNAHIRFFTSATSVGGTERVIILDSGNVGIGTSTPAYPLDVNGTARVTTLIETSTRTLKENIQSYSTDLNKFKKLNPVSFNWKDTKKEDIGLIAEELEDLFPEFVSKDDTGIPVGIQYGKLATIFINVIKEQQKRIETLEDQVKKLIK